MDGNRLVHIWRVYVWTDDDSVEHSDPVKPGDPSICGYIAHDGTPGHEEITAWMVPCLACAVEDGYEGPAGIFPLTAEDRAREADVGFAEAVS